MTSRIPKASSARRPRRGKHEPDPAPDGLSNALQRDWAAFWRSDVALEQAPGRRRRGRSVKARRTVLPVPAPPVEERRDAAAALLEQLADLIADRVAARLAPTAPVPLDRWLTAAQVAELLGVSARWAYDHVEQLGGRRLSRRCVRFSEGAVRRHLERRR